MKNFAILIGFITVAIIVVGVAFASKSNKPQTTPTPTTLENPTEIEYFWGDGCPHCENVAEFIETWEKKDEIKINKMEVWYNTDNQNLLRLRAQSCGMDQTNIGVPMMVKLDGSCLTGDEPIIDYLKNL